MPAVPAAPRIGHRLPPRVAAPAVLVLLSAPWLLACDGSAAGPEPRADAGLTCSIDESQIRDGGVGRGGIPALVNPETDSAGAAGTAYLRPDDRVVGLRVAGRTIAVPHNILWWHEVVNFDLGPRSVAVTHCPLTGSTLAFDREAVTGRRFVVSGLLYMNNLVMATEEATRNPEMPLPDDVLTLYPQMSRAARCGPERGRELPMVPVVESTWRAWREMHPETEVVTSATGHTRDYTLYPYGSYDEPESEVLLFAVPRLDPRRPPKERVLGIPDGDGGVALPFGALDSAGDVVVEERSVRDGPVVVFWRSDARGAMAFRPRADLPDGGSRRLTFEVRGDRIVDRETGSRWALDGRSTAGPLHGAELRPVPEAYVAFWFAWALFQPETELWSGPGP